MTVLPQIIWRFNVIPIKISTVIFFFFFWINRERESEVTQSCPTLCNPMDCSLPGSSVHGIFQSRVLGWVAVFFSRGCSRPRDWTWLSHIVGRRFIIQATKEVHYKWYFLFFSISNNLYRNITDFGRRQWHPTPVLLPGKSHGWRRLVGCSPWGR